MESKNSGAGIYLLLVCELYRDIAERYGVANSVQNREVNKITSRCQLEGLSFITKTLPKLGKAVDTALSGGTRLRAEGWKSPNGSSTPLFLGWLLNRVFDSTGIELVKPDPYALKHFRQLVYLVYKLEMPHDEKTIDTVLSTFTEVDSLLPLPSADPLLNSSGSVFDMENQEWTSVDWLERARKLIARVCCTIDIERIKPRHGPGAVATGESITDKTVFSRIYEPLERVFPFTEWFVLGVGHIAHAMPSLTRRLRVLKHATAKVVLVPKDSRGPRLISCEPLEVQWIQQGLGRLLVETIEKHPLTRGRVNFADQMVNRRLALEGSKSGQWVTLDMKEASDRVSLALVKYLFQDNPRFLEALLASRSQFTRLPNGAEVELRKFAPMGSALCFPVEALVFWALSASAIKQDNPRRPLKRYTEVYVYGDDIIVRQEDYTSLLQRMSSVGLKFNEGKCCVARSFRESCGCDAYEGIDVTPVKIKTPWSDRRSNPRTLVSFVALKNAAEGLGYSRVSELLQSKLESVWGKIPYTDMYTIAPNGAYVSTAGGVAFVTDKATKQSLNREIVNSRVSKLHYYEVMTWASEPLKRWTKHDGYAEWLRRLSDGFPQGEAPHGGEYAMTRRNRLKRVWSVV